MLTLDPYSEGLLFQCDRCGHVGELMTGIVEKEEQFFCWSCLDVMKTPSIGWKGKKVGIHAFK
jgi:hypothetical protein